MRSEESYFRLPKTEIEDKKSGKTEFEQRLSHLSKTRTSHPFLQTRHRLHCHNLTLRSILLTSDKGGGRRTTSFSSGNYHLFLFSLFLINFWTDHSNLVSFSIPNRRMEWINRPRQWFQALIIAWTIIPKRKDKWRYFLSSRTFSQGTWSICELSAVLPMRRELRASGPPLGKWSMSPQIWKW